MSEWMMIGIVYAILNVISFLMFVWDKYKAKEDMWRTPEAKLIGISVIAPIGSTIGMQLVRHKTRKPKFKLVYLFLIIHVILIGYLVSNGIVVL